MAAEGTATSPQTSMSLEPIVYDVVDACKTAGLDVSNTLAAFVLRLVLQEQPFHCFSDKDVARLVPVITFRFVFGHMSGVCE